MKIQFQESQLSRPQQQSLLSVLDVLQSENQNEIEVTPVEFPIKLKVKLDDDIEMLLGWDAETKTYAGLTTPEPDPIPESQKDTVDLPKQEPEGQLIAALDNAGNVIAGPELIKSDIGQRVEALANALVNLAKPFNADQRLEIWVAFSKIIIRGLYK